MSDTPRTYKVWKDNTGADGCSDEILASELFALSRQLERELAAVTAERDALLEALEKFRANRRLWEPDRGNFIYTAALAGVVGALHALGDAMDAALNRKAGDPCA